MTTHEDQKPMGSNNWRVRVIFPVAMMAVIFFASGNSVKIGGPNIPHEDKLIHLLVFGLLATLITRTRFDSNSPWRLGLIAILITSLYGVSDEFHQSFTAGRSVDVFDWVADTAGAIIATTIYIHVPFWREFLERTPWARSKGSSRVD